MHLRRSAHHDRTAIKHLFDNDTHREREIKYSIHIERGTMSKVSSWRARVLKNARLSRSVLPSAISYKTVVDCLMREAHHALTRGPALRHGMHAAPMQ